jgi:hypothetical protein
LVLATGTWIQGNQLQDRKPDDEDYRRVKLFTWDTADVIYIEPVNSLSLNPAGVITLQYALQKAVERVFKLEPREIATVTMGREDRPKYSFIRIIRRQFRGFISNCENP